MSVNPLLGMSAAQLGELIRNRAVSPVEVVQATLDRISEVNPDLNSYWLVLESEALAAAQVAEAEITRGEYRGVLHGIPLGVKDVFHTRGVRTTAGSRVLADFVPDQDATAVARLQTAGAIMMGKQATHEFAYGVTNINPHYGPTRNPWDRSRIPGGSSGGTGAALAAMMCTVGLGSDTGGSVRIPAACCGVVGLKPTYGRVSRHGVVPLSLTMDHVGPMARTVTDVALMLQILAGWDPLDQSSSRTPVPDFSPALGENVRGLRIGVPVDYFFDDLDPEVELAVRAAIQDLGDLGAEIVEVSLPHIVDVMVAQYAIVLAEASAWHLPLLQTHSEQYSPELRSLLEAGCVMPSLHYIQAQQVRTLVAQDFYTALTQADVLVTPTLPVPVPSIGATHVQSGNRTESVIDAMIRLTCPMDQAGLPTLSLPCGFTSAGLPVGFQVVGRPFAEATVIQVGHAYESAREWHRRSPPLE